MANLVSYLGWIPMWGLWGDVSPGSGSGPAPPQLCLWLVETLRALGGCIRLLLLVEEKGKKNNFKLYIWE